MVTLALSGTAAIRLIGDTATTCQGERISVRMAASPSLAPVLAQQTALFDADAMSVVDGHCTSTTVRPVAAARFGDALLSQLADPTSTARPQVWVPDAAAWSTVESRRPELAALLPRTYPVIATTPVVMAVPRPMAVALGWPKRQPSWTELAALGRDVQGWARYGHPEWGPITVGWSDALTTTAGLAATTAVYDQASRQAAAPDDVRRTLLGVQSGLTALAVNPTKALAPLRDEGMTATDALRRTPMFPWTEQQVLAFNALDPQIPVAAVYPRGGTMSAAVPLITLNDPEVTDATRKAVDQLSVFLSSRAAGNAFAAAGWRSPRLGSTATLVQGALSAEPAYTPAAPDRSTVARALQTWTALDRQGSLLVLLDVSGSMNEKVPSLGQTRLQLAQQALAESLPLFSDRTSVGLWTFSRSRGRDYHAVVPLGPLSRRIGQVSARDAMRQGVASLTAHGDTGLYDSTMAAFQAVQAGWRPGINVLLVVSDGRNDDPGSLTLGELTNRLRANADPRRPVQVLTIALGDKADADAMQRIARSSNGKAYVARSPADLESVFLSAITG